MSGCPMRARGAPCFGLEEALHGGERDGLVAATFLPWPSPVGKAMPMEATSPTVTPSADEGPAVGLVPARTEVEGARGRP